MQHKHYLLLHKLHLTAAQALLVIT